MKRFSIAIDGPAGAGKSTIAKGIAKKLDCVYVDTGAMYRSVGLYCIKNGINIESEEEVTKAVPHIALRLQVSEQGQQIFLNNENVSEAIRTSEVAAAASKVATYGAVRTALVAMQQQMEKEQSLVMDGRDIGTVVLPHATLKIFLTASVEERAKRRLKDYEAKDVKVDLKVLMKEIEERDYQDSHRTISPLKKADDAVALDTTYMTLDEVINDVMNRLNERL